GHGRINGLGTIFNMSVGYDLKGIMQENVQWFFSRMNDCRLEKAEKIREIQDLYPKASNLEISDRLSDSVTLSTMHGCPPDEIEKIGLYLIEEKKLHTIIKLNPTLLGKQKLNEIIRNSGFDTIVPDPAFEHDLTYPDAVRMIRNLVKSANKTGVKFGLKLTNTLESLNNKCILPADEKIMYMSGRALHPIAINLAAKLQNDFGGNLDISFSAGVNAFNFPKVLQSGLTPVTVCSDILKPGGYGLLNQYLKNLEAEMKVQRVASISEFIGKSSKGISGHSPGLGYLNKYAGEVLKDKTYQRTELRMPNIKSERNLGFFDCIKAPCTEACPTHQDIPDYLYYTANQGYQNAFQTIMHTNPFPNTTGMICDHLCQAKCTRINYDSPLLIRDIKRFIAENHDEISSTRIPVNHGLKAAIIGAGPSGLSCAYFLALTGFSVDVFEIKDEPGGMISGAIPSFRLTNEAFRKDIERIERLGVDIHYNCRIEKENFGQIKKEFQYIYIAAGAQRSRMPNIEGIQSNGVLDPLQFLSEK
ncbi:MAG: putative selenate reductase subunit YgfK, partial [Bacteroidetes bacterium]|nr:putative selenate reductase subunit YgfK [Bacteroidota bacterium]